MIIAVLLIPVLFLLWLTIIGYNPKKNEKIRVTGNAVPLDRSKQDFYFLSWNIGYGGLGKKMDFFYEEGKRVRPEKSEFREYFTGIKNVLEEQRGSIDFFFIQEADIFSKRSYYTDEVSEMASVLPDYCSAFAKNYDCKFVPLPLNDPMGKVISGIAVYARFEPENAERIDFGTTFGWPKQLFFLRRCFMTLRYPLGNGKELLLVNTHNSTYDKNGELRIKELGILKEFLLSEYNKGNYIIAGGDWNTNPYGFDPSTFRTGDPGMRIEPPLPPGFLPGWTFAFDPSRPSNREVKAPYMPGKTRGTLIDFFAVSPNIRVLSTTTLKNGFAFSDHQPVVLHAELK